MDSDPPQRSVALLITFWLLVVGGLLALVVVFAIFSFTKKPRATSAHNVCVDNLRQIDKAKEQWAIEDKAKSGELVRPEGVVRYLKGNQMPICPAGGNYFLNRVGQNPTCSVGGSQHSLPSSDVISNAPANGTNAIP